MLFVNKRDEVLDDMWDTFFQDFLSPDVLDGLERPIIDENVTEGFSDWRNVDADQAVSSATSRKKAALGHITRSKTLHSKQWTTTNSHQAANP